MFWGAMECNVKQFYATCANFHYGFFSKYRLFVGLSLDHETKMLVLELCGAYFDSDDFSQCSTAPSVSRQHDMIAFGTWPKKHLS